MLALALAAQAGSIIPTDATGDPVHPMITWLDRRTGPHWSRPGGRMARRVGSGSERLAPLPRPAAAGDHLAARRAARHRRQGRRYLGAADFLIHRLTGHFATDLSAACEILMVGADTGEWNAEAVCHRRCGSRHAGRARGGPAGRSAPLRCRLPRTPGCPRNARRGRRWSSPAMRVPGHGNVRTRQGGAGHRHCLGDHRRDGDAAAGSDSAGDGSQLPCRSWPLDCLSVPGWVRCDGGLVAAADLAAPRPGRCAGDEGALPPFETSRLADSPPGSRGLLFRAVERSPTTAWRGAGWNAGRPATGSYPRGHGACHPGGVRLRGPLGAGSVARSGCPPPNCGLPVVRRPVRSGRRSWPTSAACRSCWPDYANWAAWAARRWPGGAWATSGRWRRVSPGRCRPPPASRYDARGSLLGPLRCLPASGRRPDFGRRNQAAIRTRDLAAGSRFSLSGSCLIFRDPRWGHGQETCGEDPGLTGNRRLSRSAGARCRQNEAVMIVCVRTPCPATGWAAAPGTARKRAHGRRGLGTPGSGTGVRVGGAGQWPYEADPVNSLLIMSVSGAVSGNGGPLLLQLFPSRHTDVVSRLHC